MYICMQAHSTYICQLNCDVRVWYGKTRDFIMILYYWWDHLLSSTVRGISVRAKDFF